MEPKDEYLRKALAHRQPAGSGTHQDGRKRRRRTRQADRWASVKDYKNEGPKGV